MRTIRLSTNKLIGTTILLFFSYFIQAQTKLIIACKAKNTVEVQKLIHQGVAVNQTDSNGATALMWACYHNQIKAVKALVGAGATTNLRGVIYTNSEKTGYYGSLAGIAAGKGYLPLLQYLIEELKLSVGEKEYSPESKQLDGWTPIQWAGAEGKKACYDYLIVNGADELQKDRAGKSASYYWSKLEWQTYNQQREKLNKIGKYREALDYAKKCLVIANRHKLLIKTYVSKFNLGTAYEKLDNYEEAKIIFIDIMFFCEKNMGIEHTSTAVIYSKLGLLYKSLGDYSPAKELLTKAMLSNEKNFGSEHPKTAVSYSNLATVYEALGDYSRAKELLTKAMLSNEQNFGSEHPTTAVSYSNLGTVYQSLGNYFHAKELLTKAMLSAEKNFGSEHPTTAVCYSNLAALYNELGDYVHAKKLMSKAMVTIEKNFGFDHPTTVAISANLSMIYQNLGDYHQAKDLLMKATLWSAKNLGPEHPATILNYSNLGTIYNDLGEYSYGKELLTKAMQSTEKKFGSTHPATSRSYSNLAFVYMVLCDYSRAKELMTKAMLSDEKTFGSEHPSTANRYSNLAILYKHSEDDKKAFFFLNKSIFLKKKQIINSMLYLSEQEQKKYLYTIKDAFIGYNSFAYSSSAPTVEQHAAVYSNELLLKGLLLQHTQTLRKTINESGDPVLKSIYEKYLYNSRLVTQEQLKPISKRSLNTDSLQQLKNEYEVQLGNRSQAFRKSKAALSLGWKDIQQKLKNNEAAIEYISFKKWNKKWTDTTQYCALVLRKNDIAPKLIKLCTDLELQKLLQIKSKNELYRNSIIHVDAELGHGSKLNDLVWAPIDSMLTGVKKLYVSPSGLLNKISFAAIPLNDSTLLSDKYHFHQVSSTRSVCEQQELNLDKNKPLRMAMFGGITYDSKQVKQATDKALVAKRGDSLAYLPGTKEEIEAIAGTLSQQLKQVVINKYSEQGATEKQFLSLGNGTDESPEVIHIATHGFYISGQEANQRKELSLEGNSYKMHEDPMYRSGLMFANANYAWSGKFIPNSQNDGICSASEVSNLNLSNTKLVVLSACQTGLGDIDGYEGVYGLQRAFKMAGVDFLLVSLWEVPDGATAELMSIFYEVWANDGVDIRVAFRQAQQQMRELYPDAPEKWAGFVLME